MALEARGKHFGALGGPDAPLPFSGTVSNSPKISTIHIANNKKITFPLNLFPFLIAIKKSNYAIYGSRKSYGSRLERSIYPP
jgi:hypothetical protein